MIFLLIVVVGGVLLQIFLSRLESRWPGLVLPGLSFLWSLVMALNVAALSLGGAVRSLLAVLVLGNIPTLVLLAIYGGCRSGMKKRRELERMKVQDLE